ncbi:high affinity nitrate transporter 2.6-like protein [Tanacetum coccineum]
MYGVILLPKGSGGRRGVKEKNGVVPSAKEKNEAVQDGVAPSVTVASGNSTGTQEANSVKAGHDNMHDQNAGETPSNFTANPNKASTNDDVGPILTPNPGKSSTYANVTSKPELLANDLLILRMVSSWERGCLTPLLLTMLGTLEKEDVGNVPVLVKLHGVLVTAFSEDGLSAIATKLADVELKDNILVAMPKSIGEGFYTCNICVEYEWKPLRCAYCKVFGHFQEECPKNIDAGETKNLKKPSQTPRGVSVGKKVGFKPAKQVYQPVSKKPTTNTSGNKKKNMKPTKEVSKSNPFDVLTLVENDVDLGTNGRTSNLASQEANSSGSSCRNVNSSSPITTPIIKKINKIDKLIIDGKVTLVDDEEKPIERKDGYGTNSLLEQWKESYKNDDYDYDPYDDDLYEGQEIPDKIQSICDNLDIKVRGRKKK